MKKILILVMMVSMILASSCGNKDKSNNGDGDNGKETVQAAIDLNKDKDDSNSEEDDLENEEDKETEEVKVLNNVIEKNIAKKLSEEKFSFNDDLKFTAEKEYKFSELKNSSEVKLEEGFVFEGDFYGDKYSAIDTVLNFNQAWVEYVNDNNGSVFTYAAKGSEAYDDILAFSTTGLTEQFQLMEIGDVRKADADGEECFYVWTHEKIEENRNGKITLREYKWIYKLKKYEMDFKIVNFTRDTM